MNSFTQGRRGASLLGIFLLLAAGCGGPAEESPASPDRGDAPANTAAAGEPVDGDWIVARLSAEPAHLNLLLDTSESYSIKIMKDNVYQALLRRNNETLLFDPLLAESYEISDDKLTYTFHIRKDVTFSDGTPMTGEDVKFTFDAIMDPKNDTVEQRSYFTNVASMELVDEYTFRIHCAKPFFLHLPTFGEIWIMPKHIFGKGDFNSHPNNRKPIGTGPYIMESWETGLQLTLAKRKDYWRDVGPHVSKIMFKFITDDNAAFQVLQRQELDDMQVQAEQWVNRTDTPVFKEHFQKIKSFSPIDNFSNDVGYIAWNSRRPQFADKRVRRAMTMFLDRETILAQIYHNLGRVISGDAFPDGPNYNKNVKPWPYDPERARGLLDEAGWVDTDDDGIRDKDGVPFKFSIMFPPGRSTTERLATVFKEQLDKAGVEMTIRPIEWATFMETINKREFDAILLAWVFTPDYEPYQLWHSSQAAAGSNYAGFNVPEADQIIEDARVEFDDEKRARMYRRFHEILHEESPYTFLYNRERPEVISNRYENVKAHAVGFDYQEWWVPAEKRRYQ